MIGQPIEQPGGRLALVKGRVILPDEVVAGRAIVVEGSNILGVANAATLGSGLETIDVGGRYIAPGLIDIHTHGASGHSFEEATEPAFASITKENVTRGVTSMLATISAAPMDDMLVGARFSRRWMQQEREGTQVLGVHFEGPYLNPEQRGAQDPRYLLTPDDGSADLLLEASDVIRIMTLAPELPGALELIARLVGLGIVAAAGHSSAHDEQVLLAMKAGLSHVIHMWSGQSTTIREGPWRRPGLLEATLTFGAITAEIIADNCHLPRTLMKLAYKCLGADRLCVVSDAVSGAGMPEGARFGEGGVEYAVRDGVAITLNGGSFAGSTTLLNQMVPVLTGIVGIPIAEVVRMASLTPARVIGVAEDRGSLEAGKRADVAIFEDDFTVWRTMVGGRWAYARVT